MEQFGKYQLLRRVGIGGMAEVFLARAPVAQGLNKTLVIKKIHPAFARSQQFVAMFVDEAKIALGLNHPNIVQVFDFGQVRDTFFLAMEHVEGIDLLRLMQRAAQRGRGVPHALASYIVQQVAKGLDYAHRKTDDFGEPLGIVHRDISPQNVLVSWDGAVKIVDFGIARARDVQEEEGVIKGKFAYMSPEQARGEPVDRRSDVFSAGVVLFELVCQRPLFAGKGKEVLEQVRAGIIPRPSDLVASVPSMLEESILHALTFDREQRFQTARDLQKSLVRFQFQVSQHAELVDSAMLARFIAQVVPEEERRPSQLPPSARAPARARRGDDTGVSDVERIDTATRPPTPRTEVRERKHVCVVEGHLRGRASLERKIGAERAAAVVREFEKVARDIAFKHDAHVLQASDNIVKIVIGMPVASEDDVTRTIRLALALVDALDAIGSDVEPDLRLAIGIQRGAALMRRRIAGTFEYQLGEATAVAANKLAREAQGAEILVGGRIYRVARTDWTFEPLAAVDVSPDPDTQPSAGDTEPGMHRARVYRLRGPKERAERMRDSHSGGGVLLGRDLELKALRDAYRDVQLRRVKRPFVVFGDTGIGKRALVSAFLEGIPAGEAVVLRAVTRVATAYTPFAVVADLVRDLLGLAEGAEPHEVHRRIERTLSLLYPGEEDSREARVTFATIAVLLGAHTEAAGGIDADERRQRILGAMMRIEQRLSGDLPLIVVGEDVHWCDDESIELFRALLKVPSRRPFLGIVTSRPDARIMRAASELGAETMRLEELDGKSCLELIRRAFVPSHDLTELTSQILGSAGGNPFFILEMLDSLAERGIARADDEHGEHPGLLRWVRRDVPVHVPSSVEALLSTRLDRLPYAQKETIMHAAVLGRAIEPAFVAELLGRLPTAELDALARRGLMVAADRRYVFCNDMTMTVAYQLLPQDERTRLHRRAAEHLERGPKRGRAQDAIIARHLELAGDHALAAERYLAAARAAVDVGGNADAFRQLTRALKLLPPSDHERRFQARKLREEILRRLPRRPQQLREIHNLRKEAEALGEASKLALVYARLAQFYIDVGKAPAASRAVAPALQHARDAGDALAEAEALRLRASIARLVGQNDDSLRLCEQALALCNSEREGLLQRATILNNRGTTLWNMNRLQDAIESYAEGLVVYRMLELPRLEARSLNNMGIVFSALGEFEEALAHYKSSLKIDQELGDRHGIGLKLANLGQTYAELGDYERASRYLQKALKLAEQMDDPSTTTDACISLGQVHLQVGTFEEGLAQLERGLQLASANRDRYQEIRALIYLAMGQLDSGQPAEGALELARSATELARKMPMPVGETYGLAVQALAMGRLGRMEEAAELSSAAVAIQREQGKTEGAEHIWFIHSRMCSQAGRTSASREALREAQREVDGKAARLRDEELRRSYLSAKVPRAIAEAQAALESER